MPQAAKTKGHNEAARVWAKKKADAEREISHDYPPVKDVERRYACKNSLATFAKTYNPGTFCLPFSPDHNDLIAMLEEAILRGAMHARAMPRGFGKSSLCQAAVVWGLSYHAVKFSRYAYVIGPNETKAEENLNDIKEWLELTDYVDDFPEIAYPFLRLERDARRTLLFEGKPLRMAYKQDRLILPWMPPPDKWREDLFPLRPDGVVQSAGGIMVCCGLMSKSVRGSKVMQKGETLRPGLVLLDDVQDDEVAHSPTQVERYKRTISRSVMGMAGSNKRISLVAPCTCIAPHDVASWMLDQRQNPHLRGKTSGVLRSMPKNLGEWDKYLQIFRACQIKEDFIESTAYFEEHREVLLEGAEASWPESIRPPAIDAVQAAMHEYGNDPGKFWSEDMNKPLALFDPSANVPKLTKDGILGRINHHERGLVPTWANTLTASIDVHDELLFYCVTAWGEGAASAVVEYGTFPEQSRMYFALRDALPTMQKATGVPTVDGAIFAGLGKLTGNILGREWRQAGGGNLRVSQCLVDAGYKPEVVYRFCRESAHAAILMPGRGVGIGSAKAPIADWKRVPGERRQRGPDPRWTVRAAPGRGRGVMFDANFWKSFVADRLLMPMGERSAMGIFGPADHRLFADHLTAEHRTRTQNMTSGRTVDEWQKPPSDNHWFDTLVSTAVGASMQGITLEGVAAPRKPAEHTPVDVAKEQAERRAAFQAKAGAGSIADELRQRRAAFEARRRLG